LFLDRIPASAACNEAVNLGKRFASQRVAGLINGVLRQIAREQHNIVYPDLTANPVAHISLKHSHPPWLVKLWLEEFGLEETVRTCTAANETPAVTIRANLLKTDREELLGLLGRELDVLPARYAREGIMVRNLRDVESSALFRDGYFYVQGESSMLAAQAVGATKGAFIVDLCGAPGGKATHLAEIMGDSGRIVVVDIHPHRLSMVRSNCTRLGVKSVDTLAGDARKLEGVFRESADYVLVDAPCSGLGLLNHKPDIKWRRKASAIAELAELQREILTSAARCVRPGGYLVYCTCTISRKENLRQIERFLTADDRFALEDLRPFLPQQLDLKGTLPAGYVQLMPYQGLEGFFIARMRRRN
jgi:16S rRNA (cytosine967-C5)-methyltransferase